MRNVMGESTSAPSALLSAFTSACSAAASTVAAAFDTTAAMWMARRLSVLAPAMRAASSASVSMARLARQLKSKVVTLLYALCYKRTLDAISSRAGSVPGLDDLAKANELAPHLRR